jgi:hypothetical protein
LTAHLEKTILSEKMIEDDLSRVKESATKSTYKLGIGFERCEDKGEKSAPTFIPSSTYHKEKETIKSTKAHYPFNPKPSFNPKRGVKKETPKLREDDFICMFCGRVGHLDEFCFRRKRVERRRFKYARNSYRDEFFDFLSHSYSCVPPRALSHFSHGPNHRLYGFGSRENCFVPRCFEYGPRPHRGYRTPCRFSFPAGGFHIHCESRHLDGARFSRRGSHPTRSNGDVQKIVKTSSNRMVRCWISKICLTNPSTEPSSFSRLM